jgi:ribosomal protein L11 methyltransferase
LNSATEHQAAEVWHALDLEVASAAREAVEYALMEAGALGTETKQSDNQFLQVSGYFKLLPDRELVRAEIFEALRIYSLPTSAVRRLDAREVANQDWLSEWKKGWQPVQAGQRFIIAPPWTRVPGTGDRIVVRIEPGMAFGTGTHETTRLCLAAIERYFAGGSFLDVGTGTGILAIAAAKLFTDGRIEACDTDAEAIAIARKNAELNGVSERVRFRVGTIEKTTASADCVCANLTAETIAMMLPSLLAATCGRLILSGILASQSEMIGARLLESSGSETYEIMQDGDWVAVIA